MFNDKSFKVIECSCPDGFTGDFCEFKTDQNHLLYLNFDQYSSNDLRYVFNNDGELIGGRSVVSSDIIDESTTIEMVSCTTILHGEAVILGSSFDNDRRVHRISYI